MSQSKFYQYFTQEMEASQPNFQWDLKYNPQQYIYELYLMLEEEIEADAPFKIMDVTGRVNASQTLLFADRLVFYDPTQSYIDSSYYLKVFSVDRQAGMEKGLIQAIIKYLLQLVNEQRHGLQDFLKNDQESFAFEWQEENFQQLLKTLKDTQRYDSQLVSFELAEEKEKNLIQKWKDE